MNTSLTPILVAIVEDHPEVREGLSTLIEGTDGICCVGRYASCEDALAGMIKDPADVVLMDIGLPGMSGIDGVRMMKSKIPDLKVLMLTVYEDHDRIFEAICAGADGYIVKKTPPEQLINAIREIHSGGAAMSPGISRKVLKMFQQAHGKSSEEFQLSPRELEILHHLVQGNGYKVIAQKLSVSHHTVNFHIKSIYRKLHVNSKSQAVAVALRNRLR